jgi:hypothetical protein
MNNLSQRAVVDPKTAPTLLSSWHRLATTGIQEKNFSLVHHGIMGSLALGHDHPHTVNLLGRALECLPRTNPWIYMLMQSICALDQSKFQALLPAWVRSGLIESSPIAIKPDHKQLFSHGFPDHFVTDILESAIAILSIHSIVDGPAPGSSFMNALINKLVSQPAFQDGSTHSLSIAAHLCLISLVSKYKFSLDCLVVVPDTTYDSLTIFRQYLNPRLLTLSSQDDRPWLFSCIQRLDFSVRNSYACSFLIAACIIALRKQSPVERVDVLRSIFRDDILLFNASPLVARFFLRVAPPSLASEFIAKIQSSPVEIDRLVQFIDNTTLVADYLSHSERIFHLRSLGTKFEGPNTDKWEQILPCLQGISYSSLMAARCSYVTGYRFSVAMFGQVRQSAIRTFSQNLEFYVAEHGQRLSFCAISSWDSVAVARDPKNTKELLGLFQDNQAQTLVSDAVKRLGLERLYQLLLTYHNIDRRPQGLKQAISSLSHQLDHLVVKELIEDDVELKFKEIYPFTDDDQIEPINARILLNQFKMWNTIFSAIEGYILSGSLDPLLLHRADVSCQQIIQKIDSLDLFKKEKITLLSDFDFGAFVVPPIGGGGDRFLILSHEAAQFIYSVLADIHNSSLVLIKQPWPTSLSIPVSFRSTLLQHHRLCDYIYTLLSPAIYTIPAVPIDKSSVPFSISCDDFHALLAKIN